MLIPRLKINNNNNNNNNFLSDISPWKVPRTQIKSTNIIAVPHML
jgi:hypothetical protein